MDDEDDEEDDAEDDDGTDEDVEAAVGSMWMYES